ncbi:MAG: two-component regulator propeller domain-containing protein, partial [Bacteroidota bacterium]
MPARRPPLPRFVCLGLWSLLAVLGLSTTVPVSAQAFQRYGVEDGLPNVAVTGVIEDANGFLWVSTLNGLCRFDGVTFDCHLYDPDNPTSPATDYIWGNPYLVDATGTLWAGTPHGVQRYDPTTGAFVHDAYRSEASESSLLEAAPDDLLWIGHEFGLDLYDPGLGVVQTYTQDDGLLYDAATKLEREPETRALWVGTGTGFQRIVAGEIVQTVETKKSVLALHVRRDGSLLVGTFGDGLHLLQPEGTLQRVTIPPEALHVTSIAEAEDGTLWVGTWEGGLLQLDGTTLTLLDHILATPADAYGLPSSKVAAVFTDASGILWVATWNGLVRLLDPSPFVTAPAPTDIAPMVTALEGAPDGSLWIGTAEGFYSLDQTGAIEGAYPSARPWTPSDVQVAGTVRAFAPDQEGGVWVGLETGGVGYFGRERTWTPLDSTLLPTSPMVFGLLLDRRDRLWVTTSGSGVCVVAADRATSQCFSTGSPAPETLLTDQTYALEELPDGSVLVGTLGAGVLRIPPDLSRVEPYGRDSTEAGRAMTLARVATLETTPDGTLWVGALDGLYRVTPEEDVQRFGEDDGLPHRAVSCIQRDARGMLWMNTGAGLSMLDPTEGRFARFSTTDMLPALSHYFGTCSPYADALWVGGQASVAGFVPERVRTTGPPPTVLITSVEVDGEVRARTAVETPSVRIPASAQQVTVAFSGIDHHRPEGLRYAYRLDGGVDAWTEVGDDRTVTFSKLRPGRYTFRVRATSS